MTDHKLRVSNPHSVLSLSSRVLPVSLCRCKNKRIGASGGTRVTLWTSLFPVDMKSVICVEGPRYPPVLPKNGQNLLRPQEKSAGQGTRCFWPQVFWKKSEPVLLPLSFSKIHGSFCGLTLRDGLPNISVLPPYLHKGNSILKH